MEAFALNYKIPKRIAIVSFVIGILPLVPTLVASVIAAVFGIGLTEAGAPDVPFGELLYAMGICFWGFIFTGPIAFFGFIISVVWSLCILAINASRRSNANNQAI